MRVALLRLQELRHAAQLQYLSVRPSHLSVDDLALLAGLPALRHLRTASSEQGRKADAATRQALQGALPRLQSIHTVDLETDEFRRVSEALALLV